MRNSDVLAPTVHDSAYAGKGGGSVRQSKDEPSGSDTRGVLRRTHISCVTLGQ